MMKLYRSLRALLPLLLLLSLAAVPAGPHSVSAAKAHPLLLQIADQHPQKQVDVIVQKLVKDNHLETTVENLGGEVTKDLHIIECLHRSPDRG